MKLYINILEFVKDKKLIFLSFGHDFAPRVKMRGVNAHERDNFSPCRISGRCRPMPLARVTPKFATCPELRTYVCRPCDEAVTEEHETNRGGLSWRPRHFTRVAIWKAVTSPIGPKRRFTAAQRDVRNEGPNGPSAG
jgi:hypothetical protein